MTVKRVLIVDAGLIRKIDQNRGDMSRNEFISFLIDSQPGEEVETMSASQPYISREELNELAQGIKNLLHHFQGRESKDATFAQLLQKLQALSNPAIKHELKIQ